MASRTWDVIVEQLLGHYRCALTGRGLDTPVVALKPVRLARLRRSAS